MATTTTIWSALTERRLALGARGAELAKRTREAGLGALGRVESSAALWRSSLVERRERIVARPRPWTPLENVLLSRVESLLESLRLGLRAQLTRLSPKRTITVKTDGEAKPKRPAKRRIRVAVEAAPAAKSRPAARRATKAAPPAPAKPANGKANGSTRWVEPRTDELAIDGYDALSAKEIVARLSSLDADACRTLLAHERATKARRTVIEALEAKLPS